MQEMQSVQDRQERQLLTAEDVSRLLHVDASTVYRMASDGRLPAVKVGRQWRFPADRIGELLQVPRPVPPTPVPPTPVPPTPVRPAPEPTTPGPLDDASTLRAEQVQPVIDMAAELLGVMLVVTDMSGNPVTRVANPCPWFTERVTSDQGGALLEQCLAEWRLMAEDVDLQPRFLAGPLGFECARALVRDGCHLVGMVLAGGVAPEGQSADGRYVLDATGRQRVLSSLPKLAATLSRNPAPGHDRQPVGTDPTIDEGAVR